MNTPALIGIFIGLGLAGITFFLIMYSDINPQYRVQNQCVVGSAQSTGDPMCYSYKATTYGDNWYDVPTSAKIAKRSGADMNRFADYHCGSNFRAKEGDTYCKSIGRKTLFENRKKEEK